MNLKYSRLISVLTFTFDLILLNLWLIYAPLVLSRVGIYCLWPTDLIIISSLVWISVASITKYHLLPRPFTLAKSTTNVLISIAYETLLVYTIIYFFKINTVSQTQTLLVFFAYALLLVLQRSTLFFILNILKNKGFNKRSALIIGETAIANKLSAVLSKLPEFGYHAIDLIDDELINSYSDKTLLEEILKFEPNELFICSKKLSPRQLQHIVDLGGSHSITVRLIPDIQLKSNFNSISKYDNLTVIQLSSKLESNFHIAFFKRSFDILFSLLVLLAGSPVYLILTLITLLTSKGPVFFSQQRIGKDQKPFKLYKFRSMFVNSEPSGPQLSSSTDRRITKWGLIIRKSRLDELPQFWNVLIGDMSIVGPRPERQFFMDQILLKSPNYLKLLTVKPGLTSIGQVTYGYAENVEQMCQRSRYDLVYLNNMSFRFDMGLIFRTVRIMTQMKGK